MPASPPKTTKLTIPGGAADVVKQAEIEGEALQWLQPDHSALEYAEALLKEEEEDFGAEALQVLGYALQRREAVWWAIQCVKLVPELTEEAPKKEALKAAEDWFLDFSDDQRRIAQDKAEIAEMGDPASFTAMAAFFCEGSIAPVTVEQEVLPDPNGVFAMASTAVMIAAVEHQPELARERRQQFLELAKEVDSEKNRWKEPVALARSSGHSPNSPLVKPIVAAKVVPPPPKKGYY